MRVHAGIMTTSFEEFKNTFDKVSQIVDCVHVDFADGKFVNKSFIPLEKIEPISATRAEAHLMVMNPSSYFGECKLKGFESVIVHLRSLPSQYFDSVKVIVDRAKRLDLNIIVALEMEELIPAEEILNLFDGIQFMTVYVGLSGSPFGKDRIPVIEKFYESHREAIIQIDGGINNETIKLLKYCGISRVVSTSWLSMSDDVEGRYMQLKNAI